LAVFWVAIVGEGVGEVWKERLVRLGADGRGMLAVKGAIVYVNDCFAGRVSSTWKLDRCDMSAPWLVAYQGSPPHPFNG